MGKRRFNIKGRVQGVGYRFFTRELAGRLDVDGWVKNNFDGSVTAEACGAEHVLDLFEEELKQGPSFARVDSVAREDAGNEDYDGFCVRY